MSKETRSPFFEYLSIPDGNGSRELLISKEQVDREIKHLDSIIHEQNKRISELKNSSTSDVSIRREMTLVNLQKKEVARLSNSHAIDIKTLNDVNTRLSEETVSLKTRLDKKINSLETLSARANLVISDNSKLKKDLNDLRLKRKSSSSYYARATLFIIGIAEVVVFFALMT